MTALEVVLIIVGIICVLLSFVVKEDDLNIDIKEISAELTDVQKEKIKSQINSIIDEEISDISEKTEAKLDSISNTKILEMNEYADNVLGEINRNHNEVVFLYDMLNEKAKDIKSTVKDVNITKRQVEKIHAEVKAVDDNVISEPDRTFDNNKPAYEEAVNSDMNAKDIAKERLVALVRKSNERSRNEDGSLKGDSQAKQLTGKIETIVAEKKSDTVNVVEENKTATEKKPVTEKKSAEKKPAEKKTTRKTSSKAAKKQEDDNGALNKTVQFEPGATNNEKILKLCEMDYQVKDIAKMLNLGVGEVKLVIDLYKGGK